MIEGNVISRLDWAGIREMEFREMLESSTEVAVGCEQTTPADETFTPLIVTQLFAGTATAIPAGKSTLTLPVAPIASAIVRLNT